MTVSRAHVISRMIAVALALSVTAAAGIGAADARSGSGGSVGSKGTRTFGSTPVTPTAPKAAAPVQRSMTSPGAAAATPARSFGGIGKMLVGGLIGAGLFGLLSGAGFGGLAGMLGMLFQVALIGGIIYFAVNYFRNRNRAAAGGVNTASSYANGGVNPAQFRQSMNGDTAKTGGLGGLLGGAMGNAAATSKLDIKPDDFDTFEGLLSDIQSAYGREDTKTLGRIATPEMLSYFSHDLAENSQKGVRNEVSGAKLLQGDLAEAWHEQSGDYATVAMRFSLIDAMVDRNSGKVVSGDRTTPQEVTEIWTFRRDSGANAKAWQLSAIQQA